MSSNEMWVIRLVSLEMVAVIVLIIAMLICLVLEIARPGMIIFTVLVIFLITGLITSADELSFFSNVGMLTIAILFIVDCAVIKCVTINLIAKYLIYNISDNIDII